MLIFLFVVFTGAAIVSHVASDSGRNGAIWALLSLAVSGLLFFGARTLLMDQLADDGMDINFGYALLIIIAPICGHIIVGIAAVKLPLVAIRVHESSWQMTWLGSPQREANTKCHMFIADDVLAVEPRPGSITPAMQIPLSSIVAKGDGEAVRLFWKSSDNQEQTIFKSVDAPKNRDRAVLHAKAIAARISSATWRFQTNLRVSAGRQ